MYKMSFLQIDICKSLIIRIMFLLSWPKFMFGKCKWVELIEEKMNIFLACLYTCSAKRVWVLVSSINIGVEAVKCHHNEEGTKCKSEQRKAFLIVKNISCCAVLPQRHKLFT